MKQKPAYQIVDFDICRSDYHIEVYDRRHRHTADYVISIKSANKYIKTEKEKSSCQNSKQ